MSESNPRKTTSHTHFRVIVWVDVQWRKTTIKMSKSVAVILHKSFSATIATLDVCCHDIHPYEKNLVKNKLYVKFYFCHEKYQHLYMNYRGTESEKWDSMQNLKISKKNSSKMKQVFIKYICFTAYKRFFVLYFGFAANVVFFVANTCQSSVYWTYSNPKRKKHLSFNKFFCSLKKASTG